MKRGAGTSRSREVAARPSSHVLPRAGARLRTTGCARLSGRASPRVSVMMSSGAF
jgi:hypothetical protein